MAAYVRTEPINNHDDDKDDVDENYNDNDFENYDDYDFEIKE